MQSNPKKFYAGIGSRKTPRNIRDEMIEVASHLEAMGWWLRSGNARGADQGFAEGVKDHAQIWLPWSSFERGFQLEKPSHDYREVSGYDMEAISSVDVFHPSPSLLTEAGRKFMARNYRQVIGYNEPNSQFIICWTPDGEPAGGTAQAIRIAERHNIPVINMFHYDTAASVIDHLLIWHEL